MWYYRWNMIPRKWNDRKYTMKWYDIISYDIILIWYESYVLFKHMCLEKYMFWFGHIEITCSEREKHMWRGKISNTHTHIIYMYPLVIKHGWLENPLGLEVSIGKSSINGPFSIAMFDYRRVDHFPRETKGFSCLCWLLGRYCPVI